MVEINEYLNVLPRGKASDKVDNTELNYNI